MEKENERKKLTKRGKLLLVNIIALVLVIAFALTEYGLMYPDDLGNFVLKYVLIQFAVGVGSAIVYYLSIIADVMTKQNERAERDRLPRDYDKKN